MAVHPKLPARPRFRGAPVQGSGHPPREFVAALTGPAPEHAARLWRAETRLHIAASRHSRGGRPDPSPTRTAGRPAPPTATKRPPPGSPPAPREERGRGV